MFVYTAQLDFKSLHTAHTYKIVNRKQLSDVYKLKK